MEMKKVNIPRNNKKKILSLNPLQEDYFKLQKLIEEESAVLSEQSAADQIEDYKKFDKIYEIHQKAQRILNRMAFLYRNEVEYENKNAHDSIMQVAFLNDKSDVIVFRMNELLPHKMILDQSSKNMKYSYDRAALASRYRADLDNFLKGNKEIHLQNPVFVWFENIIPLEYVIDADNLDVKVFIDTCINKVFVKDDNIVNVHYAISGRNQDIETPYTIAYVGSEKSIIQLVNKK